MNLWMIIIWTKLWTSNLLVCESGNWPHVVCETEKDRGRYIRIYKDEECKCKYIDIYW